MTLRRGIKQNSLKLLNNVTRESLDQCGDRGPDFQSLLRAVRVSLDGGGTQEVRLD